MIFNTFYIMKAILITTTALLVSILAAINLNYDDTTTSSQEFQGKAYYMTKSKMDLGNWGARMSEVQKKEIEARMKNRLEKTYIMVFNKEEAFFYEDEKLDAISGATDSWGKNFAPGQQYKNIKANSQIQSQEFYGKQFLVKDSLQPINWTLGKESKQIGTYMCFKATASIPSDELTWFSFSWDKLRSNESKETTSGDSLKEKTVNLTEVEAWYAPQIPVGHGPSEYWGLPGLILEISAANTTMLCTKIVINPENKSVIEAPNKGKVVSKIEYQDIISAKMQEFRDNRGGRGRG